MFFSSSSLSFQKMYDWKLMSHALSVDSFHDHFFLNHKKKKIIILSLPI